VPLDTSFTTLRPTSTKQHTKPTDHLPTDHSGSEGEKSKPAFPSATSPIATDEVDVAEPSAATSDGAPSGTMTPTPDEGWFSDMSNLVHNQKWVIGSVVVVGLFGIGVGLFFWWRRRQQLRRHYGLVAGGEEDMVMSSMRGDRSRLLGRDGARTKELYDAFGDASDDDENADEETGLQPHSSVAQMSTGGGIGFHSGFLDDDGAPAYKDDPEEDRGGNSATASPVGSGSGSADGSWEHASQTR